MIDNGSPSLSELHLDAIDVFNQRFWVAAGIPEDIDSRETQRFDGDPAPLLAAVVEATPEHQRDRMQALVREPAFMEPAIAGWLADITKGGTREEAAQAIVDRAFCVWEDAHGTGPDAEWFASGIRPNAAQGESP